MASTLERPQTDAPVRRSPLPSAGELDAEIERKLREWDARRKREGEPAAGNGGER